MSKIKYKYILLSNLFNLKITSNSSKLTKSFVDNHKGIIPVYGSTIDKDEVSYGYIEDNLDNIKYFNDCLTINRNGSAGYIFLRQGKFTINSDVTPLLLRDEYKEFDLNYIRYILQPITCSLFSHNKKAGKARLSNIKIKFPVNENGYYDIQLQKDIANYYHDIEVRRNKLLDRISEIKQLFITINIESNNNINVPLNSIVFEHCNGNAHYTKKYCYNNKGMYPVYSANNFEPIGYINKYDFDGKYLTYSKNGYAGYITIIDGKFSINGDRCVIKIIDRIKDKVDLFYLKYFLEPFFRKNNKGRLGISRKNEYTKINENIIKNLNIQIPIPIKSDGSFDLEKQKEIANKYKQIDEIKQGLIDKINYLTSIKILTD